jgi:trehalose 6-phosphate synthase/phosphatase
VLDYDIHTWAGAFMSELNRVESSPAGPEAARPMPPLAAAMAERASRGRLRVLLDYDGTLVPLARSPELAAPDAELLELLQGLATDDRITLELVSGRPRETLEAWFGHLPVQLWAEHGFWRRPLGEYEWQPAASVAPGWLDRIHPILQQFTASTPGSHIETKTASIAWHYRGAHREFGARQAHELRMLLGDALSNQPLEVLEGKKVIEVRFRGISKAIVASGGDPAGQEPAGEITAVAFGDDRTDEDLFRALPPDSITVAVGQALAAAKYQIEDHRAARQVLRALLAASMRP